MNKAQLVEKLEPKLGSKKAASEALESVLDVIIREVATGAKVSITGFGTFQKVAREARTGRNPRTGASVKIKKTTVPRFRPGTAFKAVVADPRKLPKTAAAGGRASARTATKAAPAKAAARTTTAKKAATSKTTTARATKAAPAKKTATRAASTTKAAATKAAPAAKKTATRTATKAATATKTAAKTASTAAKKAAKTTTRKTAAKKA